MIHFCVHLQLLGIAILALGIYVIVLSSDPAIQNIAGSSLSAPGIVLVILGVLLVVIGFCGWLGALREIFVLLVVVSVLLCGTCQQLSRNWL